MGWGTIRDRDVGTAEPTCPRPDVVALLRDRWPGHRWEVNEFESPTSGERFLLVEGRRTPDHAFTHVYALAGCEASVVTSLVVDVARRLEGRGGGS